MQVGVLTLCLNSACFSSYRRCAEPAYVDAIPSERTRLSDTGLFENTAPETLRDGVRAFAPQFELWSDGASKRRWIWLPPGAQIDTSDMDAWRFPVGTKLWKEFSRDGMRVETRLLEKLGAADEDWFAMAYLWNADGSDAVAAPSGATDACGTPHDVPQARECTGCHGGRHSRALGFSAVQLNHGSAGWSLDSLIAEQRLTVISQPLQHIPGDAETQQVLGYLHANCSHCHNQRRPPEASGGRCYNPRRNFDLSLYVGELSAFEHTAVFRTALGKLIVPGEPSSSKIYKRARGDLQFFQARMPPLGSERADPALLPLLEHWIRSLPQ